jgi:hypothetical protein
MDAISFAQATRLHVCVFERFAQVHFQASQTDRKLLNSSTVACHAVLGSGACRPLSSKEFPMGADAKTGSCACKKHEDVRQHDVMASCCAKGLLSTRSST